MATINVWQLSPNPDKQNRYPAKQTAAHTIGEALQVAQAGDTILVYGDGPPRLRYVENLVVSIPSLIFRGVNWPIVDGSNAPGSCFLLQPQVQAKAPTMILDFEIGGGATSTNGGAIYAKDLPVVIAGNCIHHNRADDSGGGIAIEFTDEANYKPSFVVSNVIWRNTAPHGGGVAGIGVTLPSDGKRLGAIIYVHSNRIGPENLNQGATYVHGGGVSIYRITASILGNEIKENRQVRDEEAYGAGICVYNVDAGKHWSDQISPGITQIMSTDWSKYTPVQAEIAHNVIHDNHTQHKGGGVSGVWGAMLVLHHNVIRDNIADYSGGGVYATTHSRHLFVGQNRITGNQALRNDPIDGRGGGIHASCRALIIVQGENDISENSARGNGGAISLHNADLFVSSTCSFLRNRALSGMGGAIYSLSLPPGLNLLEDAKFAACNKDNIVQIDGCLIEQNRAALAGGAIAMIKDRPAGPTPAQALPSTVVRCVLRANRAVGDAAGIYLRRGPDGFISSDFTIAASLFEDHNDGANDAAILDENVTIGRLGQTRILDNVFRASGRHVVLRNSSALVQGNKLEIARTAQVVGSGGAGVGISFAVANTFDGAATTPRGIAGSYSNPTAGPNTLSAVANAIDRHSAFGAENTGTGTMNATGNWWGNANGPTLPAGAANGDRVSDHVDTQFFLTAAPQLPAPNPPAITAPTIGTPAAPIVPTCPDPPTVPLRTRNGDRPRQPQNGGGSQHGGEEHGSAAPGQPNQHGELALRFPSGESLVLGRDGEPIAFTSSLGEHQLLDPVEHSWLAFASPQWPDDPFCGCADPAVERPPQLRTDLSERIGALEAKRESGDTSDVLVTFTSDRRSWPLPPVDLRSIERATIYVDGWPLVHLTPARELTDKAFDWADLTIETSLDRTVAAVHLPENVSRAWRCELWLPATNDPVALSRAVVRLARRHGRGGAIVPADVAQPFGPTGPAGLVVRDFRGGTARLEYEDRRD